MKGVPILSGREAGLKCGVARRVSLQMRRVRRWFSGAAVLVILMWDVA